MLYLFISFVQSINYINHNSVIYQVINRYYKHNPFSILSLSLLTRKVLLYIFTHSFLLTSRLKLTFNHLNTSFFSYLGFRTLRFIYSFKYLFKRVLSEIRGITFTPPSKNFVLEITAILISAHSINQS